MKSIIDRLGSVKDIKIVVVGDVMLDEYIFGSVSRISPEAPVPIVKEEKREWSLGGAANVALNCKHIGCQVSLVGILGDSDFSGKKICSMLKEQGLGFDGLFKSRERITTCKKRVLSGGHQLLRMDCEQDFPLSKEEQEQLLNNLKAVLQSGSIILISDYKKGVITHQFIQEIFSISKEKACTVLVDPKGKDFDRYMGADYLKPNYDEYYQILDYYGLSKKDSIIENGRFICRKLSLKGLIVTLGEKGIRYVSEYEDIFVPAHKKEVFDLTGAGDTVFAFLALGLASNLDMEKVLRVANCAAAVAVSHLKTYAVSLEELIDKDVEHNEKIFSSWALLKIELDWLRSDNKKIVFTNGCFDLLHSGHIHLIKRAKKFGDVLVVALNTDDSIKRLKGADRPVKSITERAGIIAAISGVDFVVTFSQDTPKEIIKYLSPDILVKGGDYKESEIVGADFITAKGGLVKIVDYQEGKATSNLIRAAKRVNC